MEQARSTQKDSLYRGQHACAWASRRICTPTPTCLAFACTQMRGDTIRVARINPNAFKKRPGNSRSFMSSQDSSDRRTHSDHAPGFGGKRTNAKKRHFSSCHTGINTQITRRCESARVVCHFMEARVAEFNVLTAFRKILQRRRDGVPHADLERALQVEESALQNIEDYDPRALSNTLHSMAAIIPSTRDFWKPWSSRQGRQRARSTRSNWQRR
jgi:hypothetical protein